MMKNIKSPKTLRVGQKAPDFLAKTISGDKISLNRFRGNLVWLIFYRYPGCPLCNLHLKAVKRREEHYRSKGLSIVSIFESPVEKFRNLNNPPNWVYWVPDPNKLLYELYQTDVSLKAVYRPSVALQFLKALANGFLQGSIDGQLGQVPASFLIAEDGIIENIYYGKTIADHIPFSEVDRFIEQRKMGTWNSHSTL